jgi:hypothetical protein
MVTGFLKVLNSLNVTAYGSMDGQLLFSVQAYLVMNTSLVFIQFENKCLTENKALNESESETVSVPHCSLCNIHLFQSGIYHQGK